MFPWKGNAPGSGDSLTAQPCPKSQAPVDRCTRTGLLPLLPSGPGGFHRIALRGTSARLVNIASLPSSLSLSRPCSDCCVRLLLVDDEAFRPVIFVQLVRVDVKSLW